MLTSSIPKCCNFKLFQVFSSCKMYKNKVQSCFSSFVMKFFSLQHFGEANLVSTLIANIVVNFMSCHHYVQHHPNNLKASHKRLYCARNQRPNFFLSWGWWVFYQVEWMLQHVYHFVEPIILQSHGNIIMWRLTFVNIHPMAHNCPLNYIVCPHKSTSIKYYWINYFTIVISNIITCA